MRRTATNNYPPRGLLVVLAAAVVAAGLLALVGTKQAWAEGLSFAPAQKLPLESVVDPLTADFNGDGKEDLAVTNYKTKQVSALLGNGDGTFQEKKDFALAAQPFDTISADFNGDDQEDLAVTNHDSASASSSISVLLGNGDGTFQEKKDFAVEGKPYGVTSADFNGDGKADLAVTNNYAGTNTTTTPSNVSVLLGNGDGTFQNASKLTVGPRPESVSTADFNKDNVADLVVANNTLFSSEPSGVSVLLGKGDGTFQEAVNYAAGSSPDHVITADFNGDGNEDLATANYGSDFTGGGGVLVMLGEGNGKFQAPTSVAEPNNKPNSITAADFDGDRNVDLATTHYDFGDGNPGFVSVRLGYGDGANFQEAQNFTAANYARSIISPDLNADNYPDLVTSHQPETYGISVLVNIPPPEDTTAPTVDAVYPEEGATYVLPTDDVYVGFSEAMDRSTLTTDSFTLSKQGSSSPVAAHASYHAATKTAILDPDSGLETNTSYTATIKGGSNGAKDPAGNALERDYTWTFTTADDDTTAPTTTHALSPPPNAAGWNKEDITLTLSATDDDSGVKEIAYSVNGGEPNTVQQSSVQIPVTDEGETTISYQATDNAGNKESPAKTFTVKLDRSAPTVGSVFPSDTATGVAPTANVEATFSETMDPATLISPASTFTLKAPNGSSVPATVSYDATTKKTATLNPGSDLAANTIYTATITTGAKDVVGNALAQDHSWTFTTAAPPPPSCTKTGTPNAETISGTSGDDVICAGGGNDTIKGLGGNDTLKRLV